jgi:hypothetical protein
MRPRRIVALEIVAAWWRNWCAKGADSEATFAADVEAILERDRREILRQAVVAPTPRTHRIVPASQLRIVHVTHLGPDPVRTMTVRPDPAARPAASAAAMSGGA